MALNPNERKAIIDFLTTNCDCWKGNGDAEILNRMTDEKLSVLKVSAEKEKHMMQVANAAANGFADGGSAYRINPETGKWEKRVDNGPLAGMGVKAPPVKKAAPQGEGQARPDLDAAGRRGMMETLGTDDAGMTDDQVSRENRRRMRGQGTVNSDDEPAPAPAPPPRPRTTEEWLRLAPPDVQNSWRTVQDIERREKARIINEILLNSNIVEQDRQVHHDRLMRRSVEELSNDLAMMPKVDNEERRPQRTRPSGQSKPRPADDMLHLPTINWQEVNGQETSNAQQPSVLDNNDYELEQSEQEVINQLPPSLRRKVMQANVIENRERQTLIEELVTNSGITDEEAEKRLRARLVNKSLEELQDLMLVSPRRESARINYFGASAPTTTNRAIDAEDVLPLPTMDWSKKQA